MRVVCFRWPFIAGGAITFYGVAYAQKAMLECEYIFQTILLGHHLQARDGRWTRRGGSAHESGPAATSTRRCITFVSQQLPFRSHLVCLQQELTTSFLVTPSSPIAHRLQPTLRLCSAHLRQRPPQPPQGHHHPPALNQHLVSAERINATSPSSTVAPGAHAPARPVWWGRVAGACEAGGLGL